MKTHHAITRSNSAFATGEYQNPSIPFVAPLVKLIEHPDFRGKPTITETPSLAMAFSALVWLTILSLTAL